VDEQEYQLLASACSSLFLLLSAKMQSQEMIIPITATHGLSVSIVDLPEDIREKEH
jgi:hypothetical protein